MVTKLNRCFTKEEIRTANKHWPTANGQLHQFLGNIKPQWDTTLSAFKQLKLKTWQYKYWWECKGQGVRPVIKSIRKKINLTFRGEKCGITCPKYINQMIFLGSGIKLENLNTAFLSKHFFFNPIKVIYSFL